MAGKGLAFYQIYYDNSQLTELYPFATPYYNGEVTNYFENAVIADLVPKSDADFISVCSWRLKAKRQDMFRLTDKSLDENKILSADFDIAVLTPRSASHKALLMARQWHGQAWEDGLNKLKEFIRIPQELTYPIYENHFIARRDIYHSYVNDCLRPAMEFMEHTGSVFLADSGYARRKTPQDREAYFQKTGRRDWPISVFLLERLFSIWIERKNFKVIPL